MISTSSTEQQTLIDFIAANGNLPFGDQCETKSGGITKIILQNANGLDLGGDALTTREQFFNCTKRDVGILCLVETNII